MIIGMTESKRKRRAYRQSLIEESAFDARIRAASLGTGVCSSCTIVRFTNELDENRVCVFCQGAVPARKKVFLGLKPGGQIVYTDASYQSGVAGLAIVGALGSFSHRVYARSNVEAEVMAMRWAMNIAKDRRVSTLTFRTDSESAQKMGARSVPKWADWSVEWVPRRHNQEADYVAGQARLAV
jgi:hypothetical protein